MECSETCCDNNNIGVVLGARVGAACSYLEETPSMNSVSTKALSDRLLDWTDSILSAAEPSRRSSQEELLSASVRTLRTWEAEFAIVEGLVDSRHVYNGRIWMHSVETLLHSVMMSSQLKGGGAKLASALRDAIVLSCPPSLVGFSNCKMYCIGILFSALSCFSKYIQFIISPNGGCLV